MLRQDNSDAPRTPCVFHMPPSVRVMVSEERYKLDDFFRFIVLAFLKTAKLLYSGPVFSKFMLLLSHSSGTFPVYCQTE